MRINGRYENCFKNFFKKNTAHAYFEHRIFLSFLAGKFKEMKKALLRKMILNTMNRGRNKTFFFRSYILLKYEVIGKSRNFE